MSEKGRPLPKFGEWDVNNPASAEGFTVIFNKARDEKKTGVKSQTPPPKQNANINNTPAPVKQPVKQERKKWFCCVHNPHVD